MVLFQFIGIILVVILGIPENGSAGITSFFIRSEWPSINIPLDNEEFAVSKGHNAPQQVHIPQGYYDGKAVIISCVTADELGSSLEEYGTSGKKYEFIAKGTGTNYTFISLAIFAIVLLMVLSMTPSIITRQVRVILLVNFGFQHPQRLILMFPVLLE